MYLGPLAAQQESELGLHLGISAYQGDLVVENLAPAQLGLSAGFTCRAMFTPRLGASSSLTYNRIKADERSYENRAGRGAVMEAGLVELAVTGEWHPLGKYRFNQLGNLNHTLSPYLYIGAGVTFGKAQVNFTGNKTISPESAHSAYFIMPFGGGLRYNASNLLSLTASLGVRPVFSDNLDGVSINGNSSADDWYIQSGISILYSIQATEAR